jgi:chemotaxis methyl-accepting protein methylase
MPQRFVGGADPRIRRWGQPHECLAALQPGPTSTDGIVVKVADAECVEFLQWALPHLGRRWAGYRKVRRQVCRRVWRRVGELGLDSLAEYRSLLERDPDEWPRLDAMTNITISRFYRDRAVYDFLRSEVLPTLIEQAREAGRSIVRVWSAGCANGEEPYTLTIIWELALASISRDMGLEILATDIKPVVLHRAAQARYPRSALRDLPEPWRETAFSPEDDELYVVSRSGGLGVSERVTYSHEYTHALQDQHFDLESFELDTVGQGDRSLGRLALIEGDATVAMTFWLQQHLTATEQVALVQEALDPEALEVLEKMPPILRESLTFPYQDGLTFVLRLFGQGGWDAVNAAFARPPASTEQVLHPEKYDSNEAPIAVDLPDDLASRMGSGWKVSLEDTLGEFQLAIWLRGALRRVVPANEAAGGWGGDRIAVLEGPNGAWGLGLVTEWDTVGDATEFADAANEAIGTLSSEVSIGHQTGSTTVTLLFASDSPTAVRLDSILGLTGN